MADLTFKRRDIASKSVDLATRLDNLVSEVELLISEYWQVQGVDDKALSEAEPTAHLTGEDFTTLLARFESLATWANGNKARDILRKARR